MCKTIQRAKRFGAKNDVLVILRALPNESITQFSHAVCGSLTRSMLAVSGSGVMEVKEQVNGNNKVYKAVYTAKLDSSAGDGPYTLEVVEGSAIVKNKDGKIIWTRGGKETLADR